MCIMKQFKRPSLQTQSTMSHFQLLFIVQLLSCIVLAESVRENEISVSIMSGQLGDTFQAATWIRFTCSPDEYNSSNILSYTWIGACNETGERVFEIVDPYLDEEGQSVVWIPSTAQYCLDQLQCHVVDTLTKNEGSAVFVIKDVYGVGVAIKDQFLGSIPNNSIIIGSRSQDTVNILCHSGSKSDCSGQWLRLSGEGEIQATNTSSDCSSLLYSYANLIFVKGHDESGVFKCSINDKNNAPQSIFIAIYSTIQEVEHEAELVEVTLDYHVIEDSGVTTFTCSTEGLLVTSVSWTRDNINIGNNYDGVIQMDTLTDQYHSIYSSELSILSTNLSSLVDSVLVCDVYSDWVVVDLSTFGWQHVSGEFVIKQVGDTAVLECIFPPNHNNAEWILPPVMQNSTSYVPTPNSASLIFTVTDKASFTCQASTPSGNIVYKHYMLVAYVPDDAITISITEHTYTDKDNNITDASHQNISCCVSIEVEGVTSKPLVTWHNSHGETISNRGNFHIQKIEGENYVCSVFQFPTDACGDQLVCKAALFYDVNLAPLIKTMGYSIVRPSIVSDTQGEQKDEASSIAIAIIGAGVTAVLVSILIITTAVSTCAIMSVYKKRRQAVQSTEQASKEEELDNDNLEMK